MSEQEKEITQPIIVNGSAAPQSAEDGTQPLIVPPDAPQAPLPDWLLKFASSPEQPEDDKSLLDETDLLSSYSDDFEEQAGFTPPTATVEHEWQELSDFQEQEALEIEPLDASLGEVTETIITVDPQVEAANSFKQSIRDLLNQGQRKEALAKIRESKSDPLMAEAAKKTLRSQLTLSSDAGDLWDLYDELNSSSL